MTEEITSRKPTQNRSRLRYLLLVVLVLLFAYLVRWTVLSAKEDFGFDENIAYLAATCNQERFQEGRLPWAVATLAGEWKALQQVARPLCFGEISRGLAQTDIHPPLYFWLLHIWTLQFGVHPWAGPSLNIIISLLTAAVLYSLTLKVTRSRAVALLLLVTYALNRSVITVSIIARQYELMALLALLLFWLIFMLTGKNKTKDLKYLLLLGLVTTAGLLTHYQFILPLSAVAILAIVKLIRSDRQRLIKILLAMAAGLLLSFIIFPHVRELLDRQQAMLRPYSFIDFGDRLINTVYSLRHYYYIFVMALILIGAIIIRRIRRLPSLENESGLPYPRLSWIWFFLIWIMGSIFFLYLSFRSPWHAMGHRYLSTVWPLMVFLLLPLLWKSNFRKTVVLYFYLIPILTALGFMLEKTLSTPFDPAPLFEKSDFFIVDNPGWGTLPSLIYHIPDDRLIVVGSQEQLAAGLANWSEHLSGNTLYLSANAGPSNSSGRSLLLKAIKEAGFEVASSQAVPIYDNALGFRLCSMAEGDCP